jgi:hypothetical protein
LKRWLADCLKAWSPTRTFPHSRMM